MISKVEITSFLQNDHREGHSISRTFTLVVEGEKGLTGEEVAELIRQVRLVDLDPKAVTVDGNEIVSC